MTLHRQALGRIGETLAVDLLRDRGYVILERRYRTRHGEIDIVAEQGRTTVFVEVRARATREFGSAAESVTAAKRRQVIAMAAEYAARHNLVDRPCRFDVVTVDDAESGAPAIRLYPGAFDATG